MRQANGNYYRLTSKEGYDNLGLKIKFDIIIVFDENFELTSDIEETLDLMLEGALRGLAMENSLAKKDSVEARIHKVLTSLNYLTEDTLVFVSQDVNYF